MMKTTLIVSIAMGIIGLIIGAGTIIEILRIPIGEPVDFNIFLGLILMAACFQVSVMLLKLYLEYA